VRESIPSFWWAILVLVVLATGAILVIDPASAHAMRAEVIGWFLSAVLVVGFAVALLLLVTMSGGAFLVIWGRGYERAEQSLQEHRGVAVPAFLSVIGGLTVTQVTQAIGTLTTAESILLGTLTACCAVVGSMLQQRADRCGDRSAWQWARRIGLALVIFPLLALAVFSVTDHWWDDFLHAGASIGPA
jgi:hypothetical protein